MGEDTTGSAVTVAFSSQRCLSKSNDNHGEVAGDTIAMKSRLLLSQCVGQKRHRRWKGHSCCLSPTVWAVCTLGPNDQLGRSDCTEFGASFLQSRL